MKHWRKVYRRLSTQYETRSVHFLVQLLQFSPFVMWRITDDARALPDGDNLIGWVVLTQANSHWYVSFIIFAEYLVSIPCMLFE